jgi:hypothetical protein
MVVQVNISFSVLRLSKSLHAMEVMMRSCTGAAARVIAEVASLTYLAQEELRRQERKYRDGNILVPLHRQSSGGPPA